MTSLQFFKGFSLIKTTSIYETADWILYNANKLFASLKGSELWTPESSSNNDTPSNYCSVVKKTKKDNITENIDEILYQYLVSFCFCSFYNEKISNDFKFD